MIVNTHLNHLYTLNIAGDIDQEWLSLLINKEHIVLNITNDETIIDGLLVVGFQISSL